MEKNLKKSYRCLNLPYSATEKEIKSRKEELVKFYMAKNNNKNEKKIRDVEDSCNLIIDNLIKNGFPSEKDHRFESSNESIVGLLIALVVVSIACYLCCYFF